MNVARTSEIGTGKVVPGRSVPPILVPMHGLTRYLRASLGVTDGVMTWDVPRTLLGIVAIGMRRIRVPVEEIADVTLGRAVRPLRFVAGAAVAAGPWFALPWWAALPITLPGVWVVLASTGPRLEVAMKDGDRHRVDVCFGHQMDADLYLAALDDLRREAGDTPG